MGETLKNCLNIFKSLSNKPEKFVSVQEERIEETKDLIKYLYDLTKNEETGHWKTSSDTLPELVTKDFDEEQIWQQIELQNEGIINDTVKGVATALAKKNKLTFVDSKQLKPSKTESSDESDESQVENESDEEAKPKKKFSFLNESNDEEEDEEDDGDEDQSDGSGEDEKEEKLQFTSELDDNFFKLCEMENFCDKVEKEDEGKGSTSFNFFGQDSEGSDEERELVRYNDFFGKGKPKKFQVEKGAATKKVQFQDEESDDDNISEVENEEENDKSEDEEDAGPKSGFELRQDRLKNRIEDLENEALKEKPWHLKGEVASAGRPQNSLLEEYVEFERAARPAPVFTEKTTLRLEDIIKQRIKDKSWDDVVRKIKPVEDIREYRKRLVLDQEKSKLSLAEIYEQEFVKQRDAAAAKPEVTEEVEPEEHVEIKKMMKTLFHKLDALSNFHYTPKQVAPEVKIISNLPAITMEDVAPVATSDAALLAPEEIKRRPKGDLMSKEERTSTDKKRERRKKKLKQRMKEQDKIKKEKLLSKMSLGLGNKYSKEKAKRTLDKLTKERNVDKMEQSHSKHLKSSTAFFNQLEDEVSSQIKRKASSKTIKRKALSKSLSAKKVKL